MVSLAMWRVSVEKLNSGPGGPSEFVCYDVDSQTLARGYGNAGPELKLYPEYRFLARQNKSRQRTTRPSRWRIRSKVKLVLFIVNMYL